MLAERAGYVVFFRGKHIPEKLKTLPVNVAFTSEKSKYIVFYADKKEEQNIKKQLKKLKGFKGFIPSHLYDETKNF